MTLARPRAIDNPEDESSIVPRALTWALTIGVAWLCFAGVWLAPSSGATLVYPDRLLPAPLPIALALHAVYLIGNQGIIWADLLVACALAGLALYGRVRPPQSYPFLWPCLAVLTVAAASALARAHQPAGDPSWLRLWQDGEPMARGLLLFLAVSTHPRLLRIGLGAALAGLTVVALSGVLQHLQGCSRWYSDLDGGWASGLARTGTSRVQGLTSYINLTAAFMAAAAPMWVALSARRVAQRPWMRGACIVGATLALLTMWYAYSRGPFFALQAGVLLVAWRLYPRARWHVLAALVAATAVSVWPSVAVGVRAPGSVLGQVGVVAVVALAAGVAFAVLGRRDWRWLPLAVALAFVGGTQAIDFYILHDRVDTREIGDVARVALYRQVAQVVPAHAWTGIGDTTLGLWIIQHGALKEARLDDLPATQRNTHDQPLQWAAAQGVPVALLYIGLVVGVVVWLWRRARDWPPSFARAAALAAAAGLLAFLLCNLAEAHFWRMEGSGFFWTFAALGAAARPAEENRQTLGESPADMV